MNTARLRMPVVPASMAMTQRHRRSRPSPAGSGPLEVRRVGAGRAPLGGAAASLGAAAAAPRARRAQLGQRLALVAELGQHEAEPEVQRPADEQAAEDGGSRSPSRKNDDEDDRHDPGVDQPTP